MSTKNITKELEKNQIQEITDKFQNLITVEVVAADISNTLDDVIFKYTQYLLEDEEACGANEEAAEQLYFLKLLRDVLRNKDDND